MTCILAIDTTVGACSAALITDRKLIENKFEVRARGHVERLLPMIDEICESSNVDISKVDQIAVTIGPGTFAGVRIGLSAAKGLGLALDIPLVPITTLEVLAFQFAKTENNFSGNIAVAIDARRGEIYFQLFSVNCGYHEAKSEAEAIDLAIVKEKIPAEIDFIIGSGGELLTDLKIEIKQGYNYPDAAFIAELAEQLSNRATQSDEISPLYLRAPDAIKPAPLDMIVTDD
ncbi:MAG: tRNA (adenosine(37)-N6)-threonylcarbamoyltransferase complex dimerization subunit type 1 TsaB [Emcibacteraceae bacterium]|nr:tRNA (adenosine(37)-N6)-threonylcarbamoyltransferase complex dimerization subunit type 1 TsaB [Emcibacteraceae bacterium]